ncbi:MAG TPA: succinate dehydrogenase/fumarate reductase iron-sulfur subunit [Campylobacterales bacterium]|nr:succinate dehydrogenase/fumarate reductase iron-sulfur subunit [Campylobacterales bacterium]
MKIKIQRFCKHREPENAVMVDYELPDGDITLLNALTFIKSKIDPTLTFSSGCKSEVCGSCSVRVNGKEKLACGYKVQDRDIVEPLRYAEILKDLVVDHNKAQETLKRVIGWQSGVSQKEDMSIEQEKRVELQSDCILCASCFSSCPVLEVDGAFLGPFAMTRNYRYVSDARCEDEKEKIDAVQEKGVWDCTLCGECTLACPQGIDPKNDIMMLRSKSVQHGYVDPTFVSGGDDMFGGGFNPSF